MKNNKFLTAVLLILGLMQVNTIVAQVKESELRKQQLDFVNLGFGMVRSECFAKFVQCS